MPAVISALAGHWKMPTRRHVSIVHRNMLSCTRDRHCREDADRRLDRLGADISLPE